MGWVTWIVVGLIAGLLAELVLGERGGFGVARLLSATAFGLLGAILGGLASARLGYGDMTGIDLRSIVIATLGAIGVVSVVHLVSGRG